MSALEKIKELGFEGRHGHPCLYDVLVKACELAKPLSYLEIGVYDGASLFTVLTNSHPQSIVLCDIFSEAFHSEQVWLDQRPGSPDHIYRLLKKLGYQGKTSMLIEDSQTAIPKLTGQFDLIHIDGNHETDYAKADLLNCYPLLKSGSYLVADDVTFETFKPVLPLFDKLNLKHILTLTDSESGSSLYQKL